jgi:hypothetical protein
MQDEATGTGTEPATADEEDFFAERAPSTASAPAQTGREEARPAGDSRVDEAVARLGSVAGLPLDQQVAVFEDAHVRLRQVLSELDSEQAGAASPQGAAGQGAGGQGAGGQGAGGR